MARQTLMGLGYRVLSASDVEEALKLCEKEKPALAILDVVMPKLGGPAAAARLEERFAGICVVFRSRYSPDSGDASNANGHARVLQKSYSPTALGRLVQELLDERVAAAKA